MNIKTVPGAAAAFIRRHWRKAASTAAVILLIALLFNTSVTQVVVMLFLVVAAAVSTLYLRYADLPVKFELTKFATIVAAVAYGLVPALVVGIASIVSGKVLTGKIDERIIFSLVLTVLLAAASAFILTQATVPSIGLLLVALYNAVMLWLAVSTGRNMLWSISYEGSNVVIYYFLLTFAAPPLFALL